MSKAYLIGSGVGNRGVTRQVGSLSRKCYFTRQTIFFFRLGSAPAKLEEDVMTSQTA